MPDLEGALPLILLLIFLWVRSIGAAMKRNRQRQEQAMAQTDGAPEAFADMPERQPELRSDPSQTEVAPPRAKGPSLREQLRDMGRQLEQQMQQAAEEGRPGSMVGHVETGEAPEMPGMLRRPPPASRPPAPAPSATLATPAGTTPRRPPPPLLEAERPGRAGRAGRSGAQPLERLERYPPLARAVILSEILGRPPGLPDDREA